MMRHCNSCGTEKPLGDFYEDKRRKSGVRSGCKACCVAASVQRTKLHPVTPSKKAEYRRNAGLTTVPYVPAAVRSAAVAERRSAKAARVAQAKADRAQNRKPGKGSIAWYAVASDCEVEAYRSRERERYRQRYIANCEAERLRVRIYKIAKPEAIEGWQEVRFNRIQAQSDGTITSCIIRSMFAEARECPYCDAPLGSANKALDHLNPIALGGVHGVSNIIICCKTCNNRKHAKPLDRWLEQIGRPNLRGMRADALTRSP